MNKFYNLCVDAKIVYILSLSDLIINNISNSDGYKVAVESLEKCWEWVKFKNIEAYNLYRRCISLYNMGSLSI